MSRSWDDDTPMFLTVFGIIATIVAVFVIAFAIGDNRPRSTADVITIDDYNAEITSSSTLILTSSCGKSCTHVWEVTWDGQSVYVDDNDSWFGGSHYAQASCGVGCEAHVDTGWLSSGVEMTELTNGNVKVEWHWGWNYRRYEAPSE